MNASTPSRFEGQRLGSTLRLETPGGGGIDWIGLLADVGPTALGLGVVLVLLALLVRIRRKRALREGAGSPLRALARALRLRGREVAAVDRLARERNADPVALLLCPSAFDAAAEARADRPQRFTARVRRIRLRAFGAASVREGEAHARAVEDVKALRSLHGTQRPGTPHPADRAAGVGEVDAG